MFILVPLEVVHAHSIPHLRHGCCSELSPLSTPEQLAILGFIAKNKNFAALSVTFGFGAIDRMVTSEL